MTTPKRATGGSVGGPVVDGADLAEALGLQRLLLTVGGKPVSVRHIDEMTLVEQARVRRLSRKRNELLTAAGPADDPAASEAEIEAAEKALDEVEQLTRDMLAIVSEGDVSSLGAGGANFVIARFLERQRRAETLMVEQLQKTAPSVMTEIEKPTTTGPRPVPAPRPAASSPPSTADGRRSTGSRKRRTA